MTSSPPKIFRDRAEVVLDEPDRVLSDLLDHMAEHVAVIRTESGALLESPFGSVEAQRFEDRIRLEAAAESEEILGFIRLFVAEHVAEFAGEEVRVVWSAALPESAPPKFRKAQVRRAFDLTPRMRRVIFDCAEPEAFLAEGAGYHLRLLLPPEGRSPVWPQRRPEGGRLVWPTGEDALTSRVYTLREADPAAGTLTIDFALHEGGASPGADFARRALPGAEAGLMGPGGDGFPKSGRLLLLGDESALPAIARILAEAPPETDIDAFVEVAGPEEEQDLRSAARLRLNWLRRGEAAPGLSGLLEAALEARLAEGGMEGRLVWGGCEKSVAARIRRRLAGGAPAQAQARARVYAYWETSGA